MLQARAMARNQVEANAAIFLAPDTTYGAARTNSGQMPNDYDRRSHRGQERQYQPTGDNGMQQPANNQRSHQSQRMERHSQPPMMNGQGNHQGMPPMGQPPMMHGQKHHKGDHHKSQKHMKKFNDNRQYEHNTPTSYTDVNF